MGVRVSKLKSSCIARVHLPPIREQISGRFACFSSFGVSRLHGGTSLPMNGVMFASQALTLFILQISAWKSEAATQAFHAQQCHGILAGLFDPLRIWRSTSVACASCDLMELTGSD
jgi:hypothetical protein